MHKHKDMKLDFWFVHKLGYPIENKTLEYLHNGFGYKYLGRAYKKTDKWLWDE